MQRKNFEDLDMNGDVGDFCFSNHFKDMFLVYPAPSVIEGEFLKDIVHLPLHTGEKTETPSWYWNGDIESPTLSPSINVVGKWHGYFENGTIRTV